MKILPMGSLIKRNWLIKTYCIILQKKSVKSPKAGFCGFFEVKIDESTFLDIDCGVYCCNKFSQIRFIEITVILECWVSGWFTVANPFSVPDCLVYCYVPIYYIICWNLGYPRYCCQPLNEHYGLFAPLLPTHLRERGLATASHLVNTNMKPILLAVANPFKYVICLNLVYPRHCCQPLN